MTDFNVHIGPLAAAGSSLSAPQHGDWLDDAKVGGTTTDRALKIFDLLPPVPISEMQGLWEGSGLHTDHRLDGLLEAHGWFGKSFDTNGDAHPLLFGSEDHLISVDPRWLPVRTLGPLKLSRSGFARAASRMVRPLLATSRPKARLMRVAYRGVESAAMIYDRQPIVDIFRRIDSERLLGLMDLRGEKPFFFILERARVRTP